MKKIKLTMYAAGIVVFAACSPSIRLTETTSVGKQEVVNSVCENQDLKLNYDMWAENGVMYFSVYNKSDSPVYIDWKRSVFIYNDWKNDYWVEKSTTENFLVPVGVGKNVTYERKASTVVSERYTFIPPHTYVSVPMTYKIASTNIESNTVTSPDGKTTVTFTDNLKLDKTATKVSLPSTTGTGQVKAFEKKFTKGTSPNVFRNFLTYSYDEKFTIEKTIENEWYVSKMTQMKSKNFFGKKTKIKVKVRTKGSKSNQKVKVYDSPYRKGTSFYKTMPF